MNTRSRSWQRVVQAILQVLPHVHVAHFSRISDLRDEETKEDGWKWRGDCHQDWRVITGNTTNKEVIKRFALCGLLWGRFIGSKLMMDDAIDDLMRRL